MLFRSQDKGHFDVRLRTTSTDNNGQPSTAAADFFVTTKLTHVVFTRAQDGMAKIFVDGRPVVSATVAGAFNNWSDDFRLCIANELTGDRPWLGDLHLVAIYSRALTSGDVEQNFNAGLPEQRFVQASLS